MGKQIEKKQVEKKQVENEKRWHVLSRLINANNYQTYVEIGVKTGNNFKRILTACPSLQVAVAIDPWMPSSSYPHYTKKTVEKDEEEFDAFASSVDSKKITLLKLKSFSGPAAATFKNESIDLLFIDGDHTFLGCLSDIELYIPKVRYGGIIAGHDYKNSGLLKPWQEQLGGNAKDRFPGVTKAVNTYFGPENITLLADHVWMHRKTKENAELGLYREKKQSQS